LERCFCFPRRSRHSRAISAQASPRLRNPLHRRNGAIDGINQTRLFAKGKDGKHDTPEDLNINRKKTNSSTIDEGGRTQPPAGKFEDSEQNSVLQQKGYQQRNLENDPANPAASAANRGGPDKVFARDLVKMPEIGARHNLRFFR
jgi:hypothetical protein